MTVYALTVVTEFTDEFPEISVTLYETMEKAIEAYNVAFDRALEISKEYKMTAECHEIVTEEYRWWRIYDLYGTESVAIELDIKEVM
jgi:hypothetical protein